MRYKNILGTIMYYYTTYIVMIAKKITIISVY